jgi:hypothetical protein
VRRLAPEACLSVLVALLVVALLAGCASKEEVLAYYNAQVLAQQAKANAEMARKPLLRIEAKEGQDISFTGLKAIEVYAPTYTDSNSKALVAQHRDPIYDAGTTVLSIMAGVAGIYLSGQNMIDLASAVGNAAGHNTTVQGDYTRDGSTKFGGDVIGGDKAGRDGNWNSGNTTNTDDHSGMPAPDGP